MSADDTYLACGCPANGHGHAAWCTLGTHAGKAVPLSDAETVEILTAVLEQGADELGPRVAQLESMYRELLARVSVLESELLSVMARSTGVT